MSLKQEELSTNFYNVCKKNLGEVDSFAPQVQDEIDATIRVLGVIWGVLLTKIEGYGRNLQRHGMRGIVIRLSDKMMRLENTVLKARHDYVDESIDDTLEDLAGYAIRALVLKELDDLSLEGEWSEREVTE